jgi:hypothetical protein
MGHALQLAQSAGASGRARSTELSELGDEVRDLVAEVTELWLRMIELCEVRV